MAEKDEIAELSRRITTIEQLLVQKLPGFEAVAGRVGELATAFQQANGRLSDVETAVQAIRDAPLPGGAQDIADLRASVDALSARVSGIEQTRARGGTLSQRLASIEAKLEDPPEGETQ